MNWNIRSLSDHFRRMGAAYLILCISLGTTFAVFFRIVDVQKMVAYVPVFVLLTGVTVSLALFAIAFIQGRARSLAERLSDDLHLSQERYRLLERATNDVIWDWDFATGRLVLNEAMQSMFGYSADKIGQDIAWWKDKLHPEDKERVLAGLQSALHTGGEFWADDCRFRRGDGTYATVMNRGYIVHDDAGRVVRIIGSMLDLSDRKESEEARWRSEQKLALHVRQTPLAVIEWNLNFVVTQWNPAAEKIFGYRPGEAVGRHAIGLLVPESARSHVERIWEDLIAQKGGRRSINENITKDGRSINCEWYNTPLVDSAGKVIGVASLASDVTESRQIQAALAAEKERLVVTLRSIGDGVIATDTKERIILMNRIAEQLTSTLQIMGVGRPLAEVFRIIDVRTREDCENPVAKVLQSQGVMELNNRTALLLQREGERMISYSCSPIHDAQSIVIGTVLVFRDITEEKRSVEELLRAGKLESLGLLAGGIAHDFNNIMTVVIGNLSLAKLHASPDDKIFARLEEAEKASVRTKDLTQQLLTFAKGGTPIKQTASITELIRETTDFASHGANVKCEFALPEDLWPVDIDAGQISQVLNNLVINAVQAMPEGGLVRVAAENLTLGEESGLPLHAGKYARIQVRDNGTGIRPDYLAKIFDPYFTTKQTGSGLGLATSYSIIKKHDGLLTVESALGAGTSFYIYLPASDKPVTVLPHAREEPMRGAGRVLVMDDEPLIRELAETMLEHLGYQVELARDGAEAVRLYCQAKENGRPFDAVIMDLTIPGGMGGKETIKKLSAFDPEVRAIVSSGYSHDPVMANFREHGFRGVMGKPYKVEELAKVMHEVLPPGADGVTAGSK